MTPLTEAEHRCRRHIAGMQFADVIRHKRAALGMSQEQVAHQAGLSVYAYSSLERGRSPSGGDANPTLDTVLRALSALGMQLEEAIGAGRGLTESSN